MPTEPTKITLSSIAERYRAAFDKLYLDQPQVTKDKINTAAHNPDTRDRDVDAFVKLVIEIAEAK